MAAPRLTVLLLVVLLVLIAFAGIGWILARSPLKRTTVERFARRQRIAVVDANAAHVVGALLITHRWRRAGLVLGLLIGVVWSLQHASLNLNFLAGFLGWFVGAVVAEWRISRLDQGEQRRVAGLEPRSVTRYVTPLVLGIAAVIAIAVVVVAGAALARDGATWSWARWVLYSVAVVVVLALTARTIVGRPSGFVDPEVREADDALRCHGLTVLAGSAVAAAYPAIVELAVLAAYPDGVPSSVDPGWTFLIFVVLVALGWWVAVRSPSAREGRVARTADPSGDESGRESEPESTPA
ncbi:MAG TPA: hypothetical protein GXZ60_03185 [Intrasporangiaceae bacterium]|nr:hypothetical protein [Intrasporangiaceae bacterium]